MLKISITFFLIIYLFSNPILGQGNDYAKVKVALETQQDISILNQLNIDVEEYQISEGNQIEFIINKDDFATLESSGFQYDVIIQDYRTFYKKRRIKDKTNLENVSRSSNVADHFDYGSMGGFFTLSEIEGKLDEMSEDFPELATPKYSIGMSTEGRNIWAVKISDNPMLDEDEESVYFDAIHHAREPLSMAVTINYAFWLLENYESDDKVKYIVDNREIYIVPCVNPDGYEYNRETDPNGGGLWRKNRGIINESCVGVDLNRNYSFGYAHDENCASTSPCSNTYRGSEAFSETETIAVKDFLADIKPNTAFSIHSTVGTCLMPYGYDTSPPAYPIYSEWASDFLSQNNYTYGVTAQMLGYTSCGTTRSYLHSEGIYAWTLEIGGSGFWPIESTIFELVAENVYPLFYQTWIAGQYTDVQSHEIIGSAIPSESFEVNVEVKNKGLGSTPSDVEVVIESNEENVTITGNGFLGKVPEREKAVSQNFDIYLDSLFDKEDLDLTFIIYQDGTETNRENVTILIGNKTVLFEDDAENGEGSWKNSGEGIEWGISSDDSYDGAFSFGDSDNSNSLNMTNNAFTLQEYIDLGEANMPYLEFYTKWSLEEGDSTFLEISEDLGTTWSILKTYVGNESWHQELFDLSEFIDSEVLIRFALTTDFSKPGDGFYFDKISITDYGSEDETAVKLELSNFLYSIFPNPVTGFLNIELKENIPVNVEIFDTKGTLYMSSTISKSEQIDLNFLKPNIYIIQLYNLKTGLPIIKKVVKI